MAVVLITGCSSGFGYHTALAFARRGDRVFAGVRNTTKAAALLGAAATEGLTIELVNLDVASDASVNDGVAAVIATTGRIDVLVNNAGVAHHGALESMPWEWLRESLETNFFGALRMARAVLPGMRAARSGAIINVSSVLGRVRGFPVMGAYAASKHALCASSDALAGEVKAFNIKVAVIEPGWFKTSLIDNAFARADPQSPYAQLEAGVYAVLQEALAGAADPVVVADAIVAAATTPGPVHVLVGDDAATYMAADL